MKTTELNDKARDYFAIQQMITELEAQAEEIKKVMMNVMTENSVEELEGTGWRATWHNTKSNRFDSTAFKKAHADLYASFCKEVKGTRFTLNTVKQAA